MKCGGNPGHNTFNLKLKLKLKLKVTVDRCDMTLNTAQLKLVYIQGISEYTHYIYIIVWYILLLYVDLGTLIFLINYLLMLAT